MKSKFINSLKLFITFLRIGLFTFGGGYAMIGIIQSEIVEKKKWLSQDEMFEIIVIAESTPGPIAVNLATYCGYKVAGILGAAFATLGLMIPSLVIIYVISLFFDEFIKLEIIEKAFKGIKVGVMVLLITTVIRLASQIKKNLFFYVTFTIALSAMILFTIFLPNFTWISLILIGIGIILGVVNTSISRHKEGGIIE